MKCNFLFCVINGSNIPRESNTFAFPFILITVAWQALQDPSGSVQFVRCHLCPWALCYGLIYLDHLCSKVHVMESLDSEREKYRYTSESSEKSDIYNITVAGGVYNSASEVSKGRHVLIVSSYCCLDNTNTFLHESGLS